LFGTHDYRSLDRLLEGARRPPARGPDQRAERVVGYIEGKARDTLGDLIAAAPLRYGSPSRRFWRSSSRPARLDSNAHPSQLPRGHLYGGPRSICAT
jgi:hypothetical protein